MHWNKAWAVTGFVWKPWKLVTSISFNLRHDVIVPVRREEYQVWATLLTAMTKELAMTVVLPPYDDIVASYLMRNCFGSECPSYMGSCGSLYEGGHGVAYSSATRGETSSKAKLPWYRSSYHHRRWLEFIDEALYVEALVLDRRAQDGTFLQLLHRPSFEVHLT
jgi:hypothetical protein